MGRTCPWAGGVYWGARNVPRAARSCDYATQAPHRACAGADRTARDLCLRKALETVTGSPEVSTACISERKGTSETLDDANR